MLLRGEGEREEKKRARERGRRKERKKWKKDGGRETKGGERRNNIQGSLLRKKGMGGPAGGRRAQRATPLALHHQRRLLVQGRDGVHGHVAQLGAGVT